LTIHIPKNFIDPALGREKNNYTDPILSREGLIKLMSLNGNAVHAQDLLSLYSNEEKSTALEYRIRAMLRDGQLIELDHLLTTLDYWPRELGTIIKNDKEEYVLLTDSNTPMSLYRSLKNILFNGDYGYFAIIAPLGKAAFYSLIEGSAVYFEGIVEDAKEYELPTGYPVAIKVTQGPFKHEIVSGRSLQQKKLAVGQKVTCKLERHDTTEYVLVDIVGNFPNGLKKVIRQFNLPAVWSPEITKESKIFEKSQVKKSPERKDLTHLPFVTIDDITAKDFDDAVYAQALDNGAWRLFVAIADVANYVKLGSAIDKEATNRGVSVYFPDHVVPMLPEILSNELCSLKPDVLRYSLVCAMELTPEGLIHSFEFYPAVIRSHARLTYNQVQENQEPEQLKDTVKSLWSVYALLHEARKNNGYVFFAQQATRFVLGPNEQVLEINRSSIQESHHLIEEMMLAANKCAAKFLNDHSDIGVYRTHEQPSEQKVQLLNILLKSLDLSLEAPYSLEQIATLSFKLQEKHPRLNSLISRIMQRASYKTTAEPHFGLNFDLYSHFTSPIRRYPDLIVHRLIYGILEKNKKNPTTGYIPAALKRINYLERRAEEAERLYHTYLKVRFVEQLAKKNLKATITGLAEFGLFVELEEYPIDGMIHVSQIDNDYWTFDQNAGFLTSGHRTLRIGDHLLVRLLSTDTQQLRINFELIEQL
jgi:ribonuclease R